MGFSARLGRRDTPPTLPRQSAANPATSGTADAHASRSSVPPAGPSLRVAWPRPDAQPGLRQDASPPGCAEQPGAPEPVPRPDDTQTLHVCNNTCDGQDAAASAAAVPLAAPYVRPRRREPRRDNMPRERMFAVGAGALSDIELIALVLGTGLRGHDVFDVAHSLVDRFRSLRAMLAAAPSDFTGLRGIGRAKTAQLLAIVELSRRALAEDLEERALIDSPKAVEDYLRLQIGSKPHEVFMCLFLDARHRLIRAEESSRGSLTRMAVYPREIIRQALALNAAGLIVAHNHPSGAVKPSASDRQLTRVLRDALVLIDVQLIDHLVIGARDIFSFARAGLLDPGADAQRATRHNEASLATSANRV